MLRVIQRSLCETCPTTAARARASNAAHPEIMAQRSNAHPGRSPEILTARIVDGSVRRAAEPARHRRHDRRRMTDGARSCGCADRRPRPENFQELPVYAPSFQQKRPRSLVADILFVPAIQSPPNSHSQHRQITLSVVSTSIRCATSPQPRDRKHRTAQKRVVAAPVVDIIRLPTAQQQGRQCSRRA